MADEVRAATAASIDSVPVTPGAVAGMTCGASEPLGRARSPVTPARRWWQCVACLPRSRANSHNALKDSMLAVALFGLTFSGREVAIVAVKDGY